MTFVGIDPGDHEYGEALVDRILDEAVLGPQIEDVVLVDPGRNDQKRPLIHLLRARRVLQQLHQVVLIDHLARAERQIGADLERLEVGHLDREPTFAPRQILEQVIEAVQQIGAATLQGGAQDLRIGRHEVAGRHRIDELTGVELDLPPGLVVETLELVDRIDQPARGQQVRLLDEIEHGVVVPRRVTEAAIALFGLDHRLHRLTEQALAGILPEPQMVLPQRQLGLQDRGRIGQNARTQLEDRRPEIERVGCGRAVDRAAPVRDALHQALAVVADLTQHLQQAGLTMLRRFLLLGHPTFLYASGLPRPGRAAEDCSVERQVRSCVQARRRACAVNG